MRPRNVRVIQGLGMVSAFNPAEGMSHTRDVSPYEGTLCVTDNRGRCTARHNARSPRYLVDGTGNMATCGEFDSSMVVLLFSSRGTGLNCRGTQ